MVSIVSMTNTISTQPASNFSHYLLTTPHPVCQHCCLPQQHIQSITTYLSTSRALCISMPNTPDQMTTPTLFLLITHGVRVLGADPMVIFIDCPYLLVYKTEHPKFLKIHL